MQNQAMVGIRQELIDRLRLELVGPNDMHELLGEQPTQRYLTGIVWPRGSAVEAEDDEEIGAGSEGEESGAMEKIAPLAGAMKPSSIGLSFVVDGGSTHLRVDATWGIYERNQLGEWGAREERWQRKPVEERWDILLTPDGIRRSQVALSNADVQLEWLARPLQGRIAVSLFLVNRMVVRDRKAKDPFCLFQPALVVSGLEEGGVPFCVRELTQAESVYRAPDKEADELLYRHQTVFAVGHGTAAEWEGVTQDCQRAALVKTVIIPAYVVPQVLPEAWRGGGSLAMDDLADAADGESIALLLGPLLEEYESWIQKQEVEAANVPQILRSVADEHLAGCRSSLARMRTGLDLIQSDPQVLAAFRFANQAMAMQRRQTIWGRQCREAGNWVGAPDPKKISASWRPFQIAFILQSMTGLCEPDHPSREIADLLWFPTGGGKTEAYLGLSAFGLALRRLRGDQDGLRGDAGVSIIMRYTLRLLTIQQFQRASALICACEILRSAEPQQWGKTPFRIGLWVGKSSTPNTFDDCVQALKPKSVDKQKGTPVQLHACPWCNHPLQVKGRWTNAYNAIIAERRLFIQCVRKGCAFHGDVRREGIPAVVTDEEIYRLAPSMVIGTVDKFALLPKFPQTSSLFGRITGEWGGWGFATEGESSKLMAAREQVVKANHGALLSSTPLLPPDLIIQDELHLISGPLGTMVGLYESAIDALCSRPVGNQVVGPKVIASTATIRRAKEQVDALFGRNLAIFPSPGIEAGNSFFAMTQPTDKVPGRLYVGINAPGRSMKTALVRVYAALLASPGAMNGTPEELDPYQTLVGYFNSLRELGGAVRLLEDDVAGRISVLANRKLGQVKSYHRRPLRGPVDELTSRIDSADIPATLARLERSFAAGSAPGQEPVDAVLASNMISVGVDVPRLGLMVVTGQPKTTAEYIQATSRVGREFPGLVVTVYNWARPRDLSHYEQFMAYHSALYRYVEAISVTPFSARARDRGLAAVFVAMARLGLPGLAPAQSARKFKAGEVTVKQLRDAIVARAKRMDGSARADEVSTQLTAIAQVWGEKTGLGQLSYTLNKYQPSPYLLYDLGGEQGSGSFPAPSSMRDVEASIGLYLREEGE